MTSYKENLLINAKHQMRLIGGTCRISGTGDCRMVRFDHPTKGTCQVWFPESGRVNNLEINDLKEAVTAMSGYPPFTL